MTTSSIDEAVRLSVHERLRVLPAEDENAIQNLLVTYGLCADFGLVDEIVELFEPDAVWDGSGFRFPRCEGRDELRAWFSEVASKGQRQLHVMEPALLHQAASGPDTAGGIVSFNAMEAAPDGHGVFAAQHAFGLYEDEYRKREGVWRFSRRVLHLRLVRR